MIGCLACDLTAGREPLPGGRLHATGRWVVEHCVGPLGLGALIVKPTHHVTHGPALQLAMFAASQSPDPSEVDRVAAEARRLFTAT